MPSICLYFQVHQPNRLKPYTFFDLGVDHFYEDDALNKSVLDKVSDKCYIPANNMMLELINKHKGKFKIAFSISGVALEQFEHHRPDVLASFKKLADTGCVEFLSETYYHSLAYLYSKEEFTRQVEMHRNKIEEHFGQTPQVFRNTELIYYNELASFVERMGYKGILAEGVDYFLKGNSPNYMYKAPNVKKMETLLRNNKLSDDIAFRFSEKGWKDYPLTAKKYASWLKSTEGDTINLFMDYETIGEHHWEDTGIFDFWKEFPGLLIKEKVNFLTPTETINRYKSKGTYDVHTATSWADSEKDLSAWNGNTMQQEALDKVYELEPYIRQSKEKDIVHVWSKLQTSDHFYYMSTKFLSDGAVHAYFSPYNSPYDGYIFYMNAVSDVEISLENEGILEF